MLADWVLDTLRDEGNRRGPIEKMFYHVLSYSKTVCIKIDQVADYVAGAFDKSFFELTVRDLLPQLYNLMPPAQSMWFEYAYNPVYHGYGPMPECPTHACTAMVFSPVDDFLMNYIENPLRALIKEKKPSYALIGYHMFGRKGKYVPLRFQSFSFLYPDGSLMRNEAIGDEAVFCLMDPALAKEYDMGSQVGQDIMTALFTMSDDMMRLPLMTLSLLNVKNIKLHPHAADPALQKKRKKLGRLPALKTHTLDILVPGERLLKDHTDTTRPAPGATTRPLHLVRGHLSDYRHGKGLFGKHQGVFWMPAHMRGHPDNGIVNKRYHAKTPAVEASPK